MPVWADNVAQCDKLVLAKQYKQAQPVCRKEAEQGYASAQFNLGVSYAKGDGVMTSGAAAADWFYKAGLSYLKQGHREYALWSVERIKELQLALHFRLPNAFLADQLLNKIYGKNRTK